MKSICFFIVAVPHRWTTITLTSKLNYFISITFRNNNDIILYPLEQITSLARVIQYIFMAQCIWWLASCIGLQLGLVVYVDNLHKQATISNINA